MKYTARAAYSIGTIINPTMNNIIRCASSAHRSRVVILGGGWAGYRIASDLDKAKYDVHVISPCNHFLFTPLLASTAVGTLEFRCIEEPIRIIKDLHYYQASCEDIDFESKVVKCRDAFIEGHQFDMSYDKLIIACGSENNTFGIKGVETTENVFFMKKLSHARAVRNRLIDCFERASSPACSEEDRKRLLTFVVVGGGPTSIELAAEMYDFLKSDVSKYYPDLFDIVRIKIIEASDHILGTFNRSLSSYVERLFRKRNVELLTSTLVSEISGTNIIVKDGTKIPFGMVVWSTGVKQIPLMNKLISVDKAKNGRLIVDAYLRVQNKEGGLVDSVFALGDCAVNGDKPLPQLAQVAAQQGMYLAKYLNGKVSRDSPFKYQHLGSLASIGDWKGVWDGSNLGNNSDFSGPPLQGFLAFILWRAAYWTKQVSITNKLLIPMFWFKSAVFGRDISRF